MANCKNQDYDYVEILNGDINAPALYKGCETTTSSIKLATTSSTMHVHFHTGMYLSPLSSNGQGFVVNYQIKSLPSITITSPTGTKFKQQRCSNMIIKWTIVGDVDLVNIYLILGGTSTLLASSVSGNQYIWPIPCDQEISSDYRIKIDWVTPTRVDWWKTYCGGSGPGCEVSVLATDSFQVDYCGICGDHPTAASEPLSTGGIVGLVIGLIILFSIVAIIVFLVVYKKKNGKLPSLSLPSMTLPSLPSLPSRPPPNPKSSTVALNSVSSSNSQLTPNKTLDVISFFILYFVFYIYFLFFIFIFYFLFFIFYFFNISITNLLK